jgi:hypothetical protein
MKKKIIITFTICLFAAGSIFNMNLALNDQNMDISLADISIMAQAEPEYADLCDNIWTITVSGGFPSGITYTCTTGGSYACHFCKLT